MYRTIEDIKTEYAKRANEYKTMRQAWEAVTIKTRKNGSEYKTLTMSCIEGATIGCTWDGLKQMQVGGWCTGYVSDEINVEEYGESRGIKYAMAPEEARAAIASRISYLAKQEEEQRAALAWLEDNAGGIFDKIESFRNSLTEGAPDKAHMAWALGEVVGDLIRFDTNRKYWR